MNRSILICLFAALLLTGCSGLIDKAKSASADRAAKFSDAELCEHYKSDDNDYYKEANAAEVKKRGLSCN